MTEIELSVGRSHGHSRSRKDRSRSRHWSPRGRLTTQTPLHNLSSACGWIRQCCVCGLLSDGLIV